MQRPAFRLTQRRHSAFPRPRARGGCFCCCATSLPRGVLSSAGPTFPFRALLVQRVIRTGGDWVSMPDTSGKASSTPSLFCGRLEIGLRRLYSSAVARPGLCRPPLPASGTSGSRRAVDAGRSPVEKVASLAQLPEQWADDPLEHNHSVRLMPPMRCRTPGPVHGPEMVSWTFATFHIVRWTCRVQTHAQRVLLLMRNTAVHSPFRYALRARNTSHPGLHLVCVAQLGEMRRGPGAPCCACHAGSPSPICGCCKIRVPAGCRSQPAAPPAP